MSQAQVPAGLAPRHRRTEPQSMQTNSESTPGPDHICMFLFFRMEPNRPARTRGVHTHAHAHACAHDRLPHHRWPRTTAGLQEPVGPCIFLNGANAPAWPARCQNSLKVPGTNRPRSPWEPYCNFFKWSECPNLEPGQPRLSPTGRPHPPLSEKCG